MSVTFTPTQSWIALAMFAVIIIFSVYNASLNIAAQEKAAEAVVLAQQRNDLATAQRQEAINQTKQLLNNTSVIENRIIQNQVILKNTTAGIASVLAAEKDDQKLIKNTTTANLQNTYKNSHNIQSILGNLTEINQQLRKHMLNDTR